MLDYDVDGGVRSGRSGVDTTDVRLSMNPFDEFAAEESVRLREHSAAGEVIAVSCGMAHCDETLRHAMTVGAGRAL